MAPELAAPSTKRPTTADFCVRKPDGTLEWNFHPGQTRALLSQKRFVVVVAGTRGGKTAMGALWLYEEIRRKGPGVYLVIAPTFPLLHRGAQAGLDQLFHHHLQLGRIWSNPLRFVISKDGQSRLFAGTPWEGKSGLPETVVYLVHATDPNALEAVTAKAAWCDEAGQEDFKVESWEALGRRLSIDLGRCLITTTPYNLGWLRSRLFLPWQKAKEEGLDHPDIDVIQFRSIDNPAFPVEEYYRQQREMPFWRWDMMYNANFTVPSGLVYDCIVEMESSHKIAPFPIPTAWPRLCGIDFGGINTYALFAARVPQDYRIGNTFLPEGSIVLYREYYPQQAKPVSAHVAAIRQGEPFIDRTAGGAKGEGQWRDEFWEHGMMIEEPSISDVDTGIQRAYGLLAQGMVYAFDSLQMWWNQMFEYRYETDPETGLPLPEMKIVDQNKFHAPDAFRYLSSMIMPREGTGLVARGGGSTHTYEYYDSGTQEVRQAEVIPASSSRRAVRGGRVRGRILLPGSDTLTSMEMQRMRFRGGF